MVGLSVDSPEYLKPTFKAVFSFNLMGRKKIPFSCFMNDTHLNETWLF